MTKSACGVPCCAEPVLTPPIQPQLYFRATGVAVDVPVWVPKPNVDLKICMYDRLYQDSVLVHTR